MSASEIKDMLRNFSPHGVRHKQTLAGGFQCDLTHDEFNAWCEFAYGSEEIVGLVAQKARLDGEARDQSGSAETLLLCADNFVQSERAAFLLAKSWYEDLRKEHVVRITDEQHGKLLSILDASQESGEWARDLVARLEAS